MSRKVKALGNKINFRVVRSKKASQPRIDVSIRGTKVVLPTGEEIGPKSLVKEHAEWILEKKKEYERYKEQAPERKFELGEKFPFFGDQLELVADSTNEIRKKSNKILIPESKTSSDSIKKGLENFYRQKARKYLENKVKDYAKELGVEYNQIQIRNQRTRWASCSPKKNLSFNWRLMMIPPEIIDYVVIHELTHLREKNHTQGFWQIVSDYVSDYEQKEEWLDENSSKFIFTKEDL